MASQPPDCDPEGPQIFAIRPFTDHDSGAVFKGLPTPLPCAFCGVFDVTLLRTRLRADTPGYYHGECNHCGAEGPPGETPLEGRSLGAA